MIELDVTHIDEVATFKYSIMTLYCGVNLESNLSPAVDGLLRMDYETQRTIEGVGQEGEANLRLEPKIGMLSLPVCPYCNLSVEKKDEDSCHYPTAKRDGGIVTVPGHHLCNLLAESQIPRSAWPVIREARTLYFKYKLINRTVTRITNMEKGLVRMHALKDDEFKDILGPLKKRESEVRNEICRHVKKISVTDSVVKWLLSLEGIGPLTVLGIIATLYPLNRFNRVSALWHFTGHIPRDALKAKNGKLTYNPNAKRVLNELAISSIKNRNSYLRGLYEPFRVKMNLKFPESKGHQFNAAMFRAKKSLLKELWIHSH